MIDKTDPRPVPGPYVPHLATLRATCPECVAAALWQEVVPASAEFVRDWGPQAERLGWRPHDLFGLTETLRDREYRSTDEFVYDLHGGLMWLLHSGRRVVAMTTDTAIVRAPHGMVLHYRARNKPSWQTRPF
jgi:hypothetical protein